MGVYVEEKYEEILFIIFYQHRFYNKHQCTRDEARLTIEFKKHYIIMPTTTDFNFQVKKFKKNKINGEEGNFVKDDFQYDSGNNINFLNIKKIQKLLKSTG